MISKIPASRKSDPLSSFEAEEEINRSGSRSVQQKIVLSAVKNHQGCTSRELTMFCDLDRYQVARRLADLEGAGRVVKGRIRKCGLSGRKAVVWFSRISGQMEIFK